MELLVRIGNVVVLFYQFMVFVVEIIIISVEIGTHP